jgi:hypothetical protein
LHIYITAPNDEVVDIYQVDKDWTELGVTWNNKPTTSTTAFSYTASGTGWKTVDITALVQKWLDGTSPNYGLLLDQESAEWSRALYDSREGTNKPFIRIEYSGRSADVEDIADAWIWQIHPDENYGNSDHLTTGYVSADGITPYEKQSLLKFDIEYVPDGGCTLTPGYWKTHSEFGTAPYDDTWAQLPNGASTIFFTPKNTQTYYQVLWTSPAGNAYYQLSFQYIAAGLNFLAGASVPSEVQTAYNTATTLFNTYTPAQIGALRGSNALRQQFIALAGILGDYNSGITGPGHCDDIEAL